MQILGLFGPPNIEKLKAKGDLGGLIKALGYNGKNREQIRRAASDALVDIAEAEPLTALFLQPDEDLRADAVAMLARIGVRAIDALSNSLNDASWEVRRAAVESLAGIDDERSIALLVGSLRDRHARVRESTSDALRRNGATNAGPIIAALDGADDQTRERLVTVLGETGDARAVEPLLSAFKDASSNVRNAAGQALKRIGAPAIGPLCSSLTSSDEEVRRHSAATLGDIGDASAVDPLVAALKDGDWSVRRSAAEALGKIGDARSVEHLVSVLTGDVDEDVRSAAAGALGKIGDERAIEPLVESLKQENWTLRRSVIEALETIGGAAIESLVASLSDMDESVREAVSEMLGDIGVSGTNPLIAALSSENSSDRRAAAVELGELRDPQAVEPLISKLGDANEDVRIAAAIALGQIADERAAEPLVEALGDSSQQVRENAVAALISIGPGAVPALLASLESSESEAREASATALGRIKDTRAVRPLFALLNSEDRSIRMTAAHALGMFGSRVLNALVAALEGDDEGLREAAVVALGEIGDEEAVRPLLDALRSKDRSVQFATAHSLGKIGGSGIDTLMAELKNVFWDVRLAAATALGESGDERAVQPLQALLNDSERRVRDAAQNSLEQIEKRQAES